MSIALARLIAINVVKKWFIRARLGTEMVKGTNQMDYYLASNVI
jgi:hypothetical protein